VGEVLNPQGASGVALGVESTSPIVTVIIPSRDRPGELRRCLEALGRQDADVPFEIVVVDDGSMPPVAVAEARVVRTSGQGPAAARNAGAAAAMGAILAFTDDDTIPAPGWVRTIVSHLKAHPEHVGVQGPVTSPPFDPLTEHSIDVSVPGHFLTCNVAYRHDVFAAAQGFHEGFPHPHCEDLDLGFRLTRDGEIGFAPEMAVVHPPRRVPMTAQIRRGRLLGSELLLRERHPDLYTDYAWLPARLRPIAGLLRGRGRLLRSEWSAGRRSPGRLILWMTVTLGQAATATAACLSAGRR
jgi:glycosyltransferase involved in cell wall biosynthesis